MASVASRRAGAQLLIDDHSGRKSSDTKNAWLVQALDAFADRLSA